MTEEEKILERIEALQEFLMNQMSDSLKPVFKDLSAQVVDITDKLSLDPKDRAKSLREMMKLKKDIADTIVGNEAYQSQVDEVIKGFGELAALSDSYMALILDRPFKRKALYDAILEVNAQVAREALLGAGIRDNFSNAIQEVLKSNISGVTSRAELRKTLARFIEGTPDQLPFLERYIKQTTNDSVMVFNREYMQTISADLDIQHYRYRGTKIAESRPFCVARTGKVYTKDEVEAWAAKDWEGKMKGTNKTTIFSYCGGYNCRHILQPISKLRYEKEKKAEK